MKARYVLAPQAARYLVAIWRHIKQRTSVSAADRVESAIRDKMLYLARAPLGGHWRKDLTDRPVRFLAVYSYLIVYRPEARPLEIVAILHANRDVKRALRGRF